MRQSMDFDEQIVGALPSNEILMRKGHVVASY
jgi:hypothetical protein